jgi:glycosyltransferase involved in cell wall biosynthesis
VSGPIPERLRVALLNAWFWPEVRRGSERVVHDLALELIKLGHRPRLLTSHPGRTTRTVEEGFEIVRSRRPPDGLLVKRNFQEALTHLPFSYLELLRGDDDLAHAVFPSDALAALAWSKRSGRPAVFSYMGVPQRDVLSNKRLRLRILEKVTREADAVIAISGAARDNMWRWLGVEGDIIYPGTDLDHFTPGGARAEVPTIVSAAATADDRKRVDLLVRAFGLVRREHPEARLLLVRPGDPAVEQRFAADGVEFYDLDSLGVVEVFREAWVSGLASYNEAFGLVLVESLACGTPVFGRRDGGVPEIIDRPEVGRLFEGDREEDLARAILEALELSQDPATAAACRERAGAFGNVEAGRAHEALYRRVLAARQTS